MYFLNISKSYSITPALRNRSVKKAIVVVSEILFITPIPTNILKGTPFIDLEFKLVIADVKKAAGEQAS